MDEAKIAAVLSLAEYQQRKINVLCETVGAFKDESNLMIAGLKAYLAQPPPPGAETNPMPDPEQTPDPEQKEETNES